MYLRCDHIGSRTNLHWIAAIHLNDWDRLSLHVYDGIDVLIADTPVPS
jgi:hypothetical protein